jgi:hypothetical protein
MCGLVGAEQLEDEGGVHGGQDAALVHHVPQLP